MRRHPTTAEKQKSDGSRILQINGTVWNLRAKRKQDMGTSVLPAGNYHSKYHSVSGASALSQSMKYAEAWLYGSLHARPSARTAFLDLRDVCCCPPTPYAHRCKMCTNAMHFGTVRQRVFRNLIPQPDYTPYDFEQRQQKPTLVLENGRRSILECDVNPYELVRKDDDCSSLISEEDFLYDRRDRLKKKSSFREKFRKLQEIRPAKMIMDNLKNVICDEKTPDGVSIAGQKIRIFNTIASSESIADGWISDEEQVEVDEAPKRPPRRKMQAKRIQPVESNVYENVAPSPSDTIKSILKKPLSAAAPAVQPAAVYERGTLSGKAKKQVQFKVMRDSEDESGRATGSLRTLSGSGEHPSNDAKLSHDADSVNVVQCAPLHDDVTTDEAANNPECSPQCDPAMRFLPLRRPLDSRPGPELKQRMCSRPAVPPPLPPVPYLPPRQCFPIDHNTVNDYKIPSLTETFLQNRSNSVYASGVIKINVPPTQVENRTIVTITPEPISLNHSNGKTCVTVNADNGSPPEVNKVVISLRNYDISYDDQYKSNIEINGDTKTEFGTQTDPVAEFSYIESSNSSKTIYEEDTAEDTCENDFSLHYMSSKINEKLTDIDLGLESSYDQSSEPIYEEISDTPPPLPLEPPPAKVDDIGIVIPPRSIFEGASKYDILRYLAGAKERCRIPEEPEFVIEELIDSDPVDAPLFSHSRTESTDVSSRLSHLSNVSDSSDELASLIIGLRNGSLEKVYKTSPDIERTDSGVGSETSKCSRSKWQNIPPHCLQDDQLHICEDCDQPVETQLADNGIMFAPLACRKCLKRRIERREIMAEIVETEEKYARDLRITLDEFYKPMLVAGLLSADQLSAIFLNVEELLEHSMTLAEKLRDGFEIAVEQGDEDLSTFNIGKIFLDAAPMLHAFESYCTRQGNAALLLANLEKEKELLKIFLRVSQMENAVLRRMNLNSFLMVPVQRVTKYPLLLARLYKVTPEHHTLHRELLKEAQHNIELYLEHINSLTKDIGSMKLWRRISMMNGRRISGDAEDMLNIKLQKIAVEVLEWGHEEVRFAMEGRLFYAQPTDYNWKRAGRTIKVLPVNALLVTLGKPTENYTPDIDQLLMFPQKNGIREASLLLMREKGGKYSLVRDPLFLDHCIVYCDNDWEEYFEVQEIPSKETYIFKGEDEERTKQWYRQLQYHCQGLGCWRKRRNALANIMINGMQIRT